MLIGSTAHWHVERRAGGAAGGLSHGAPQHRRPRLHSTPTTATRKLSSTVITLQLFIILQKPCAYAAKKWVCQASSALGIITTHTHQGTPHAPKGRAGRQYIILKLYASPPQPTPQLQLLTRMQPPPLYVIILHMLFESNPRPPLTSSSSHQLHRRDARDLLPQLLRHRDAHRHHRRGGARDADLDDGAVDGVELEAAAAGADEVGADLAQDLLGFFGGGEF
jgi:hypothetical protein